MARDHQAEGASLQRFPITQQPTVALAEVVLAQILLADRGVMAALVFAVFGGLNKENKNAIRAYQKQFG
jgi:hypothetical protein